MLSAIRDVKPILVECWPAVSDTGSNIRLVLDGVDKMANLAWNDREARM